MRPRILLWLMGRAFASTFADNCFNIAKGAAFSATLSLFPGLLLLAALLLRGDSLDAVEDISIALGQVLPRSVHALLTEYLSASTEHSARWLAGAGLVVVLAGSQLMISFMEGFRAAYRLPRSWSFWKEQGVAIALVFLAALPLGLASGVMVFGRQFESWIALEFGRFSGFVILMRLARWVLAIATITGVLGILYHVGPSREQRWSGVWAGALFATLLWLVSTLLFAVYVQNFARYSAIYGGVTTMVVLLIWLYLVSSIVMIGCEFNAERERLRAAIAWEREAAQEVRDGASTGAPARR